MEITPISGKQHIYWIGQLGLAPVATSWVLKWVFSSRFVCWTLLCVSWLFFSNTMSYLTLLQCEKQCKVLQIFARYLLTFDKFYMKASFFVYAIIQESPAVETVHTFHATLSWNQLVQYICCNPNPAIYHCWFAALCCFIKYLPNFEIATFMISKKQSTIPLTEDHNSTITSAFLPTKEKFPRTLKVLQHYPAAKSANHPTTNDNTSLISLYIKL